MHFTAALKESSRFSPPPLSKVTSYPPSLRKLSLVTTMALPGRGHVVFKFRYIWEMRNCNLLDIYGNGTASTRLKFEYNIIKI